MNTIIKLRCVDQVLTLEDTPVIASGGQGEDVVQVSFCSKWDGMTKTAVFWRKTEDVYHVLLDDKTGEGVIPWEVLVDEGILYFGVLGVSTDGRRRTSNVCRYRVEKGALIEGKLPADPTPSMYEQILAREAELQGEVDGVMDAVNAAADAAAKAESAAKAAAAKAESAAEDAAAAAVKLVQENVAEAVEMAQTASAAAETAAQSAQQAVKKAEAAAEEAATSAKKEVLEMGAVLYSFGSYEGTGARRTLTLPVTPKLVHIWGDPAVGETSRGEEYYSESSPAITLGQGETLVNSTTTTTGKSALQWVRLEGNTLVFDWDYTLGSLEGVDCHVDHLNTSGVKYSIAIVYAPGDEVDNTVQLTVVNEFGELAEGKEFYVKVGEMTYKVDTVLRLEKGTEVNCFVQDTVDGCSLYYNGHWENQSPEYKHYIRLSVPDGVQLCYTANTFGDFSGVLAGKRSTGSNDTLPRSLDQLTDYSLRMLKDDNILYLKVWKAEEDEPADWNLTYIDDLIGAPVGDESDAAYNWKLRLSFCDSPKGNTTPEYAWVGELRINGGEDMVGGMMTTSEAEAKLRSAFDTTSGLTWNYFSGGHRLQFGGYGSCITTRERMSGNYELLLGFRFSATDLLEKNTTVDRDEGLQIIPFKDTTNPKVTGGQWNYTLLLDKDTEITLHDDGFGGSRVDIDDADV